MFNEDLFNYKVGQRDREEGRTDRGREELFRCDGGAHVAHAHLSYNMHILKSFYTPNESFNMFFRNHLYMPLMCVIKRKS